MHGDLRRYHLFVSSCIRAAKYWFRLLHMKENKLPKQALTVVRDFVYIYASLKSSLLTENYLDFVGIKCFKDVLIKLRMGVLPLNANRFHYAHENASKILCSVCETEIEDEVHFICFCPLYNELRQKYIHRYLQTEHCFTPLMQCHEKNSSQNLPFFIYISCL